MLSELLRAISEETPPSTNPTHDITVALIGAAAPLLLAMGALLTALRGRLGRRGQDSEDAARVARYERFLLRHDMDPQRILTGNEEMTDVRLL